MHSTSNLQPNLKTNQTHSLTTKMSKINALTQTGKANIMLIGAICLLASLMLAQQVSAINLVDQLDQSAASGKSSVAVAVVENPELVARVLDNLLRSILFSTNADYQVTNSL